MNTEIITNRISRFIEQMGLDVSIEKSTISESKYIIVELNYKIRISNHELPYTYQINFDSPNLFVGGSTGCTWQEAIEKVADHFNKPLSGPYIAYKKRMQTIKEKNETASNIGNLNLTQIDNLKNSIESDWKIETSKRSKWFYFNNISVCGVKSWTWEDARDSKIKELKEV
ncbi:hypothetical protein UFOVP103_39 [uncultured Caudovirales phage]|uniref:Large polyvalent protein associated domain-containing protein n=1 Tax=uncultured Caudovirales phage TaxID=2100421 RepID=A0A6J7WQ17_9CAUD|nr:hypothetical protein UFOVP103_39 [uncultured Caudovirales phage]CAB5216906.1 hypothetical protein UFOVP197_16 [uncultured Caudovirales phage]